MFMILYLPCAAIYFEISIFSSFFFFKQKTAYEISECDWSPDVCSSDRSEEHTSELQSHSEISYAVFCLKKKKDSGLRIKGLYSKKHTMLQIVGFSAEFSLFIVHCSWFMVYGLISRFFFFKDTATTEIYTNLNTLSLHDALPISRAGGQVRGHHRDGRREETHAPR